MAAPSAAQSNTLEHAETLLSSGRLSEARATLDRWIAANPPGSRRVNSEDRARARLLQGRLTADVREAEEAYLSVVLSYPRTRVAPDAMLRLGQVLVAVAIADGDTAVAGRASGYLQRLVDDYPGSDQRTLGMLWLARAHEIAGAPHAACDVTRSALRAGIADPVLASLFETERDAACSTTRPGVAGPADSTRAPERRAERQRTPPPPPAERPAPTLERFSVQAAAVRDRAGAERLAARLRQAGFDPRIVRVEGSGLHRVRMGRYVNTAPAAQLARRLRQAGFDVVVVTDAHREAR
jgi:cell division septation protein DedD